MKPFLGITGYSGSGKTTLLEKLLPKLTALGLNVAVIKHSHHNAEVDKAGKDSWRMKEAGASQVIMACDQRWALMTETPKPASFDYLMAQFDDRLVDLILIEGFKHEPMPKLLLHRQTMEKPLPEIDENVLALATDYPVNTDKKCLNINDIDEIAQFIWQYSQKTAVENR
ncbi:molybdopterin-guanine dinucleotide biosynthesis protein MobB [Pasteurellaceae bacterium Pebbles2]|nr:molybdopterin-guanine dinucleotide biosynthesis protein MobB [Pasteurellaceae bacterium Pebbles2]